MNTDPILWAEMHLFSNDGEGCITVGLSRDNPEWVELHTEKSKDPNYYGKINFSVQPAAARLLGQAFIEMADKAEKQK